MKMFCSKCGAKAFEEGKFCPDCGHSLEGAPLSGLSQAPIGGLIDSAESKPTQPGSKIPPRKIILIASALSVVALVAFITVTTNSSQQFQRAISACNSSGGDTMSGAQLESDGNSLYLDGSGEEDYLGMSSSKQFCILEELGMPQMVKTRMLETNALMGVQEAEWDGITAKWTYHPNNGMDVSLEK